MKLQILILLATTMAVSCDQHEDIDKEVFAESGSVAVLPCNVFTSDSHSSAVHWKRKIGDVTKTIWRRSRSGLAYRPVGSDVSQRASCPQPNFGRGNFDLQLNNVRKEDGGIYYCTVEQKKIQVKKIMLRVVQVSFNPAEVVEDNSLQVDCDITPSPSHSVQTMWELNNSAVTKIPKFKSVSQAESGTWSCLVLRKDEVLGKASASLQVKGILNPKDNSAVVYAEVGSSVTLPCVFSDVLIIDRVSWNKASTASGFPASFPSTAKTSYDLHIKSVEQENKGIYECSGQIKTTTRKTLTIKRNMQLVTAQVQSSSRTGQLSLSCELSDSSRVTRYEWLRVDYGENDTQTLSTIQDSASKILKVPKGEEEHRGGWVCRFYKLQMLLGNASYNQPMMSGLEGKNESGGSRKVFTILGLSLVALLVGLILLQLYKNHRRRKMIMQYPAMETIVHLAANERERVERNNRREKEGSVNLKSVSV